MKIRILLLSGCLSLLAQSSLAQADVSQGANGAPDQPEISDGAQAHFAMGWTAYMEAKSAEDFSYAAREFGAAVLMAPGSGGSTRLAFVTDGRIDGHIAEKAAGAPPGAQRPPLFGQPNLKFQPGYTLRLEIPDPVPASARDHFAKGMTMFNEARSADALSQAAQEFAQAASVAPDWLEARYNRELVTEEAVSYPTDRQYRLFRQANAYIDNPTVRTEPSISEEARGHFIAGVTIFKEAKRTENFAQAAAEFRKAVELSPYWPEAHYNLVLATEAAGDYPEALRVLNLYLQFPLYKSERRSAFDKLYEIEAKEKMGADAAK